MNGTTRTRCCLRAAAIGRVAAVALAVTVAATSAQAARHALVVGVGGYDQKTSGLAPLNAPASDAESMARVLRRPSIGFEVDVLTDDAVKDKALFNTALSKLLTRIRPGDEVLFYFSGHGINLGDKGNYFLPLDSKDQDTYIRELRKKPGSARELDTQEKENARYKEYLTETALSENEIEAAIKERGADVVIIIADACRTQISGAKGLVPVNGLKLPTEPATGTFRLYAARRGQASYDSPENKLDKAYKGGSESLTQTPKGKDEGKGEKRAINSLFTSVLLKQIVVPRQEINVLFSIVKLEVRDRARSLYSKDQVPDFDDSLTSRFYFWKGEDARDIAALCSTADAELERLRRGVAAGSIFADEIERKRNELAPCSNNSRDYFEEINGILRLHEQGGGGALASFGQSEVATDPYNQSQQCDALAASPLDQQRPQGVLGVDLQAVAIDGRASDERRLAAVERISRAINACTAAVNERGRVARYKFNLASAHYAMATLMQGVNKAESLTHASKFFQDAVDLGYPAAYNGLALLHQNGEFYDPVAGKPLPRNRQKAFELFQRGADLGHVLALYHLGMAYKNGLSLDDETDTDPSTIPNRGTGKAFQLLSKSAEAGFLPAMIETALALRGDWGSIPNNPKRAIELLEIAASRGSWEAMYQLGRIYDDVDDVKDPHDAIIWYARAAEAGDTRSQERLAQMLAGGDGLPAAQRDAAGRYWRLAADGGSMSAQMQLANLLRDGKLPFRPKLHGNPDGGAEEIRALYVSALARGNTVAGYELGRLYRSGFPKERPSEAIPKDPETAVALFWNTMDRVRQARPDSVEADPMVEVQSAFEILGMHDASETKRKDGTELVSDDQVDQLRADYGDRSTLKFLNLEDAIRLAKIDVVVTCRRDAFVKSIGIWDWKRSVAPTDPQFDWFEHFYKCRESDPRATAKRDSKEKDSREPQAQAEEVAGLKRIREFYRKQFEAWTKERDSVAKGKSKDDDARPKSFTDWIGTLLAEGDPKRPQHRR